MVARSAPPATSVAPSEAAADTPRIERLAEMERRVEAWRNEIRRLIVSGDLTRYTSRTAATMAADYLGMFGTELLEAIADERTRLAVGREEAADGQS